MTEGWAIGLVCVAALLSSAGALFLKLGSKGLSPRKIVKNHRLMAGIALYGISTVLFIPALRGGSLSVLYPLTSTQYVWVSILSQKFLGEKMNPVKWAGVLAIIAGITLVGISR